MWVVLPDAVAVGRWMVVELWVFNLLRVFALSFVDESCRLWSGVSDD